MADVSEISFGTLLWLMLFARLVKATDMSRWTYIQRGGDIDTGCLHNLTLDDKVVDRTFTTKDERAFLLDLYQETGGPKHWKNKTNWNVNGTHHCQWFGVQCYPNNTYVKWINMIGNNLVGTPSNLWKFRNLQGICFSRNKNMTGNMLNIVFSNMTRLRRLSLSFSDIYGKVPWGVILKLKNLEKLQICCTSHKRLTGNIPWNIGDLYKLQVFSIGENNIKGRLPESISNLTKLWFLDLEYAHLTHGDLSYFSNMTNLISLHMTNCKLDGTLPRNFGTTHPNLKDADLSGNMLKGEWKQSLVGLQSLQHLSLSRNQWHGLLPKSLGSLNNLKTLDLSHNYFSGFEEDMTFNAKLEILYLNGNQNMTGDIKHFLAALQPSRNSLRVLNASNCGLRGELTTEIWNTELLIYLDLSNNHLSGVIPVSDGYLSYLIQLSLASNNFSGNLDANLIFSSLKVLRYLSIQGNPRLRSHNAFLSYMKPNYETVTQKMNFSCPSITLTTTGGNVDMDPSLYDYSLCFCDQGFYGYSNNCLRCMEGGTCDKDATRLDVGAAGTVTKESNAMQVQMTIRRGYWPCCNGFEDVQRLIKCNKEQTFDHEVCSPSGDCKCSLEVSTHGRLKTSCNSSCICHHGNTGRFCSKCTHGFYKRGDVCVRCPEFRKNFPVVTTVCFVGCLLLSVVLLACFRSYKRLSLAFMFVLVTTLTVLHFTYVIPGWFFIIIFGVWIIGLSSGQKNSEKSLQGFICIAVFFFQSLDAMLSEAKIWPHTIILLKYKITNVFNFEIAELTCSFSGVTQPEVTYAILLLLPVGGIVGIWMVPILGKAIGFGVKSSTYKRLTIEILVLLYFPITTKTFNALSPCTNRDGLSYLRDAPWLDCHGTSYNWLVSLGFISLGIFVVGIPTFVYAPLLYRHLRHNGELEFEECDAWLKPLYQEFTLKYRRYFPLVFLARRLLLAVSLSLIPTTSCYQVLTITLVLIVFITITFIARPYEKFFQKFEFENMADILVSVVLLLSFVGLASLRNASTLNYSLVWFILSLNLIIMFCCIAGTLILFAVHLFKSPEAENDAGYEQLGQ